MIRKETKEVHVTSDGVRFDKREDAVQRQRYLDLTEYLKDTHIGNGFPENGDKSIAEYICEEIAFVLTNMDYQGGIISEILNREYNQEPAKKRGRGRGRAKNK